MKHDTAGLVGLGSVVYGVGQISPAAAWIVGGCALLAWAYLDAARSQQKETK